MDHFPIPITLFASQTIAHPIFFLFLEIYTANTIVILPKSTTSLNGAFKVSPLISRFREVLLYICKVDNYMCTQCTYLYVDVHTCRYMYVHICIHRQCTYLYTTCCMQCTYNVHTCFVQHMCTGAVYVVVHPVQTSCGEHSSGYGVHLYR